jgi:RNA polymerase sigma-70 factor (ECF subfamily)
LFSIHLVGIDQHDRKNIGEFNSLKEELPMLEQQPIRVFDDWQWKSSKQSDDQLLQAARAGDGLAFEALSGRYCTLARQKIYGILHHREDTEDVMQDTLLKAFNHLNQFQGSSRFSTWFTRIAINSAIMLLRKRRIRAETSYDKVGDENSGWDVWDFPDPAPDPEHLYAKQQKHELLRGAVRRLPETLRHVVNHYHGQERSLQETAEALGISVPAAKSRLLRARITLRSSLKEKKSLYCGHLLKASPSRLRRSTLSVHRPGA